MTYKNIFKNPEFNTKYQKVRDSIEHYLADKNYELNELTVDDLITWKDIGNKRIIETTDKCPTDINNILTDLIKEEFPNLYE